MHIAEHSYELPLTNLEATNELARKLANCIKPGLIIYLLGDLGAGKTTLVRAMLAALGHTGVTKSPTYTLVETYSLADLTINHFDLYRIADPSELEYIGIRDYITPTSICIFEWAKKGLGHIPQADIEITLSVPNNPKENNNRTALLVANSTQGEKLLQAVKQAT